MKRTPRSFRSAILSAALLASLPVHADELPPCKAGLWEMKDRVADPTLPEVTTQQCIDDTVANKKAATASAEEICSSYDIRKTAAGYVIDAVCKSGARTTSWHSEVTGDLNAHYVATSTTGSRRDPSAPLVELTTITDATWLGDCKPDQHPGDLIITGGPKMKVEDAEKMGMIPMGRPR